MSEAGDLLDSTGLIALLDESHARHEVCLRWMAGRESPFCTCPTTQGAVVRVVMRNVPGATFADAQLALKTLSEHPLHRFLPDDLPYAALELVASWATGRSPTPTSRTSPATTASGSRRSTARKRRSIPMSRT